MTVNRVGGVGGATIQQQMNITSAANAHAQNAILQAMSSGGSGASTNSAGTTPSSLCSTPGTLLGAGHQGLVNPHLNVFAHQLQNGLLSQPFLGANAQMNPLLSAMSIAPAAPAGLQNAFEGLPIFMVPQSANGLGALSLNAFQRISEFKALSAQQVKIDTSKHFHVFVGDLSSEVDSDMLKHAFQHCGEISEAKVIRDPQSLKSRGYGFVAFPKKEDAIRAIEDMNGKMVGRRVVRTNWASRRNQDEEKKPLSYDEVYNAAAADNTTVYIGNIGVAMTEEAIRSAFTKFGTIKEIRLFGQQNYGFVIFDSKESATKAILAMSGQELSGQTIKCSWGRSSESSQNHTANALVTIDPTLASLSPAVAANLLPQISLTASSLANPVYQTLYGGHMPMLPALWQ
ncbi:Protein TIAR-1 f [Aphelenchoides avenae]|nr:Protein TIAR-1 f [Aphelenchus avenae]